MKKKGLSLVTAIALGLLFSYRSHATVISTDTAISPLNTGYDGTDLIVSNCTVTLDGAHSFNSLTVATNGVLTHSYLPNGSATLSFNVLNEVQVLNGNTPVTLQYSNVAGQVIVTDSNTLALYTNGVDYIQTNLPDGTTQIYTAQTSSIPNSAVVYVTYTWSYSYTAGLNLIVSNDVNVASGGSISLNGNGYGPAVGSGRGLSSGGAFPDGSGAGHGGNGGMSSSNAVGGTCYDSLYQPVSLGSGGGASYAGTGGNGGGKVQIVAGGTVNIDGVISANGADATNSRAGGGAGGSIWIVATNFSGAGSLTANGGAGEPARGGGGGGGRISIQCGTNIFLGNLAAYGGFGAKIGGAGTVYTQTNSQVGLLVLDNGGRGGTNSTIGVALPTDVVIRNGAAAKPTVFVPRNLVIGTNSTLSVPGGAVFSFTVSGDMTIQAGGALSLDRLGSAPGTGLGAGVPYGGAAPYPCGGGGFGGSGGMGANPAAWGGGASGSQVTPVTLGGGGGNYPPYSIGGASGGALQLNVSGTLQVDGHISANGGDGSGSGGGGGAGGGIYISHCTTLTGTGSITANGGAGVLTAGGGGGGGRISIIADRQNNFSGVISAYGGNGAMAGGAGTIFTSFANSPGTILQVIADNGGLSGTNTPVQSISTATLVVRNGAHATASSGASFGSLLVTTNGWLTPLPAAGMSLTISGNAIIQAGGGFMGDQLGHSGGQGSGTGGYSGSSPYYAGGGGAYGGNGGNTISNLALGGTFSGDTAMNPSVIYAGSGGSGIAPSSGGGSGAFLQMTVSGTLQLDGLLSANGGNGSGPGGGGGSGGGVNVSAGSFIGAGSITVNGGAGANGFGGGGGGGRIAVTFNSKNFTGSLSALGGGGANYGGGGTIYFKTNTAIRGQVVIDNAGHAGASTTWNSSGGADLALQNGALCYLPAGTSSFGNLLVGSNSLVIISNSSSYSSATINAVNVTIQAGGGINSDFNGYAGTTGTGAGGYYNNFPQYLGGGGGHGGYGAASAGNLASGGSYMDTMSNPTGPGGGGGGNSINNSLGGRGGGVVIFSLSGYLQVDGTLSANGGNGSGIAGGGGAGGSLNISCAMLTGGGNIVANGGNGVNANGGGGGGGMIYANYVSNIFSGTILAGGGGGAGYGGAGTIYFRTNTSGQTTLIVDNGGHIGTNTPLATANSFILRNGATAFQASPPQSINNLLITSNAWLVGNTAPGNSYRGIINLGVNNAVIQAGGGISGDGGGNLQNSGTGGGFFQILPPYYQCGGGSHGGDGGGFTNENNSFDFSASPSVVGSGGGGFPPFSTGGNGGGYLRLTVLNSLQLDGVVTANGGNGGGLGGGGGSGGSIYISSGTFGGAGTIVANGGNGTSYGGGGGGGRIAVYYNNNNFTGGYLAYGGGATNCGGAGTIYTKTNNQSFGRLLLDNGTNSPGAGTTFDYTPADVIIQSNATAVLAVSGSWSPHTVLIRTNAQLLPLSHQQITVNDLTIDAGGVMKLDGNAGFGLSDGTSGFMGSTGGGGHGGYGTGNPYGYGNAFDKIQTPSSPGGRGAGTLGQGGQGGGVLTLSVNGTLTVNGRLSANGANGYANSGGGAGGSLYFPHINQLAGTGIIAANGGSSSVVIGGPATGTGGSGGGGRISITCNSNIFTGQITAFGGNGLYPASAGTVFTRINGVQTLLVDNGGLVATNTPLGNSFVMPAAPFDLNISGGAIVAPLTPLPLINNLNLATGSVLTLQTAGSNLVVAIQHDANIGGNITLDFLGYKQTKGTGAGGSIDAKGGGGGYGGAGGNASTGATGGITNGSAAHPADFGSGGGAGFASITGGSEGGGAVRLSVGGTLNLDGTLTANGDYGWQDDSGGGAGGSVWITANTVTGSGMIAAMGGNGDLWNGGGGGGGRIAMYSPTNLFAGSTNVIGGLGWMNGQPGSVFLASTLPDFLVLSQSPTGAINNTVSSINLSLSEAVDPASVSSTAFTFTTPAGVMDPANLSVTIINNATIQISFPQQNLIGNYSLQVAPALTNILGTPLAQPFTGNFSISLPTISGTVSDTNGTPVAGVLVQPDGGLIGATTDSNGNYAIGVPPGWNGGITPALGSFMFIPGTLSYTNVTVPATNQNYLMVVTVAPAIAASTGGTNLSLNWTGITGVTYQAWASTNLLDWTIYGNAIPGTNGPMQIMFPLDSSPGLFFRLGATH